MLALYGHALQSKGLEGMPARGVIRLRSPVAQTWTERDFALIRTPDDRDAADRLGRKRLAFLGESVPDTLGGEQTIVLPNKFNYLDDGDILGFDPQSKSIRTHFRKNSTHNAFLVTERCDHYCLMCSQPPRNVDDAWILDEISDCIPLIDPSTVSLGFTGGEPFLEWRALVEVLRSCRDLLPATAIHVLSNGRAFSRDEVVRALASIRHGNLTIGIPIYSAVDHVHNYVVQAQGAFDETLLGILKLKDRHVRVEIRVVLHALTVPSLVETAKWLARNLPFVDHVALMGLENTGFALANAEELWIDPLDYRSELAEAVRLLRSANLHVSVYNLQRCVLDKSVWPFAPRSISDWKNAYLAQCTSCAEKANCAGFFETGRPRSSRGIAPILS